MPDNKYIDSRSVPDADKTGTAIKPRAQKYLPDLCTSILTDVTPPAIPLISVLPLLAYKQYQG
jgi:hypothetical protein